MSVFLSPNEVADDFIVRYKCQLLHKKTLNLRIMYLKHILFDDSIFSPYLWTKRPTYDPKITNGAESFHAFYNSQFCSSHANIYKVIDVL